ncbi:GFA family protein [Solilutibacter silvestris]|uniref:Glutathione-dependent formaldehyde-activating enzyme n=1 Tax=Solilutibacter silvestris TaxID=1645665 RepID=A0A2K1PY64_9GAMM|nr:GFA family protein [Lysobacter silvestris]PNS07736.1 Glutathione-dependent formaldehyde-activating enzyme [Lysobacter silvestris]
MEKTYHGSCHCGAVKYSASLDLAKGTGKCNCTYCMKIRNWSAQASGLELLQGEDVLGDYSKEWPGGNLHHRFCSKCGVTLYANGHIPEAGGDFLSVQVNTLDDASIDDLLSGPMRHADGRNDNWMNPPAETRHL